MPTRSQRHVRNTYYGEPDYSGQTAAYVVTEITNPGGTTTVSEDLSTNFGGTTPLTFSALNLPENCTINATTGVVSGTSSAGTYADVTVFAVNAWGSAKSVFSWTIS